MLKKISSDEIRLGMHLTKFCGAWLDHPFWRTDFVITDPADIQLIRQSSIKEVWIDTAKGDDLPATPLPPPESAASEPPPEATAAPAPPPKRESIKPTTRAEELKRAARICDTAKDEVASMFHEVRMGKAISAEAAGELVEEISSSVMRNPGALISLSRLKTADA